MKLEYNILCIDDEIESLDALKRRFGEINAKAGIYVNFHDVNAQAGARETDSAKYLERLEREISDRFANNTFEIILIDLHLKNGIEGHQLIDFIRHTHTIYRPVIFYSAGNPKTVAGALDQLTEAARAGGIFGKNILISHRNDIGDVLAGIAGEMHEEEHKINQVRGLLMDRVSEFEAMVIRAVASPAIWEAVPDEDREKLLIYARDGIGARLKTATQNVEALEKSSFDALRGFFSSDSRVLDTSQKTRFLKKMLTTVGLVKEAAVLQEFIAEGGLNSVRNNYAHRTADALDADHSTEKCIQIRGNARKQISNIKLVLDRFS